LQKKKYPPAGMGDFIAVPAAMYGTAGKEAVNFGTTP
jgi:hypothetical protein